MVSAILRNGLGHLAVMRNGLERYMTTHGFASLSEVKGRVTFDGVSDPGASQRASYIHTLQHKANGGNPVRR